MYTYITQTYLKQTFKKNQTPIYIIEQGCQPRPPAEARCRWIFVKMYYPTTTTSKNTDHLSGLIIPFTECLHEMPMKKTFTVKIGTIFTYKV